MRTLAIIAVVGILALGAVAIAAQGKSAAPAKGMEWAMNATIIEACSCPMFCQCYFNSGPAAPASEHAGHEGHAGAHYCRFNNAFKVNRGHYKSVKLDGIKFWVAGDLGGDFSDNEMEWAVLTFDKSMPKEQRDAVAAIIGHLYPVKWKSLSTAEGDMVWKPGKNEAYATIDGGKVAEVRLKAPGSANNPAEQVVIKNLKYWGAPRNTGFVLMPNEVEAYRTGDKAFEFKGTNGFMITLDIDSATAPPAAGAM